MNPFNKNYFFGGNSNYGNYETFRHKIFWLDKIRTVLKFKKSGKLLDVGCAFGYFVKFMKENGFDVYGIDVSEYAISRCKEIKSCRNNFFVHNLKNKLPFKKNYFDVITAFDVIEHIKEYKTAVKNLVEVLNKNGILIISTPLKEKNKPKSILNFILNDKDKTHISLLTENEIGNLLTKNKLKILCKRYYSVYVPLPLPEFFKNIAVSITIVSKKLN